MLGGRALLAFQGTYEKTESGDPTADAMLGAIMHSETQIATIKTLEALCKFIEGWARSKGGRAK